MAQGPLNADLPEAVALAAREGDVDAVRDWLAAGGAPDADIAVSISLKRGGPASLARQKSSPTSKPLASKTSMPIIHKMPSVAVEAPPSSGSLDISHLVEGSLRAF